jgi:hypothetical protein
MNLDSTTISLEYTMEDIKKVDPYLPPQRPEEKPAANVFELLDRILDKGLVIIGDIRISVADIELLKLQIRLLIASVDTAKKMGIDFSWAKAIEDPKSKDQLRVQVQELEDKLREQGVDSGKGPKSDVTNPEVTNPEVTNPEVTNPEVTNPDVTKSEVTKSESTSSSETTTESKESSELSE